ncbi:penicillin binding protein PBP4B [Litorilituus lipolyticus]|nr:penicillin binding protein PBP4B [Litorilituus lipolyticus]
MSVFFLTNCTSQPQPSLKSKNYSERIKFVVLHYTAGNYQDSLNALTSQGEASAHYFIPQLHDATYHQEDLKVIQLVSEDKRAWHSGESAWQNRENLNDQSIGIELVNEAHCKPVESPLTTVKQQPVCFFPDFQAQQIELLINLLKKILAENPDISPTAIVGHSDISPMRKRDPGPRFPWFQLYQSGIGAWYDEEVMMKYYQTFNVRLPSLALIQKALNTYGYAIESTGYKNAQTQAVVLAFQQHFMPWHLTKAADARTAATIFALIEKYFPQRLNALTMHYHNELQIKPATDFAIKRGQVVKTFPEQNPSSRALVNNRASFKAYQGAGEIIIDNISATSADMFVNGEKLSIAEPLIPHKRYRYSLKRRTHTGDNTLMVENIKPEGAKLTITIPYPDLTKQKFSTNKFDRSNSAHNFTAVDTLINNDVENGFPGAVLLVQHKGEIIKHTAYGYARKYNDEGALLTFPIVMEKNTVFDIASNTKMFATNIALMKLISEGRLSIDLPLSFYIPEYQGEGREFITVKDILTHRSGYTPQVKFYDKNNKLGKMFYSQNKQQTQQLLIDKVPLSNRSKTTSVYSDVNYILLGLLIEKISGVSLDQYVEQFIYQPLGLDSILYNPLQKGWHKNQFAATEIAGNTRGGRVHFDNVRHQVLQGEVHDETAFYSLGGVAGHAGLFSNAESLAVLAQALLNRGGYNETQLFTAKVLDQFVKPDDGNGSFGLGWRRANNGDRAWHFGPYASAQAYGHTGWTGTVTVIDPKHDLAIILLTNARHSDIVGDDKQFHFLGKTFETAKYGSVVSLIYEAILTNKTVN